MLFLGDEGTLIALNEAIARSDKIDRSVSILRGLIEEVGPDHAAVLSSIATELDELVRPLVPYPSRGYRPTDDELARESRLQLVRSGRWQEGDAF